MAIHAVKRPDDARMARQIHKAVREALRCSSGCCGKGADGAAILEEAARHAVRQAAHQADDEGGVGDGGLVANALLERLPGVPDNAFLEDLGYTVGQLRGHEGWLAVEAGGKPDANTVDGSVIWPEEALMEAHHTAARFDAAEKEAKAGKVQAELLTECRDRILSDERDLQKIARYDAHLSRQMYQALHELEALQAYRGSKVAPLA